MTKQVKIANANNIPVQFPCFADPKVPYETPNQFFISVLCRGDAEFIKRCLEQTPLDYVDDYMSIYIGDFRNAGTGGYCDAGVIIHAGYKGKTGGHYIVEFEDHDYSIAAGRELWGYPKKYGKCRIEEDDQKVLAICEKGGVELIRIEMDKTAKLAAPLPAISFYPHLQMQVIGKADGPGIDLLRIIERDTSSDYVPESRIEHPVKVTLKDDPRTPVAAFTPVEILGGAFVSGNHRITEEHGWGKVIDTLINDI